MDIAVLRNLQPTIGNAQSATKKLPMAGLEPARANYGIPGGRGFAAGAISINAIECCAWNFFSNNAS